MHKNLIKIALCVSLTFTFHLSPFTSLHAQQPWNPSTLADAYADNAYLIEPPAELRATIESQASSTPVYNTVYHLSGPYRHFGRSYMRFLSPKADFRLPEETAQQLLPHLVSCSYWQQRFQRFLLWSYVDMQRTGGLVEVDTTDRRYGSYSPLRLLAYNFQPSEQWPVTFTAITNTHTTQTLSLRAVERLAEWGAFLTEDDLLSHQQRLADLNDSLQALDAHLENLDSQFSTSNFQLSTFIDSLSLALFNDSMSSQVEQQRSAVERTMQQMDRNEIFIMNIKSARSEYMFGLELNLYNCFERTISLLEFTVVPYNDRGQVQEDKFHRSTRTVRCMGPIQPHSPAQYVLDELFWNDRGRIKYMRLTAITFHFTDGTRRSFSGYNQILKHTLKP